jgi:uncharacterized protein
MFSNLNHPLQAHIVTGQTWHKRDKPVENSFAYGLVFLLLPMRAMSRLAAKEQVVPHNRRGLLSFWDSDHGLGKGDALAWAEQVFTDNGLTNFDGEIWLQTLPRILGYAFKPVSYWFAVRPDGTLAAVLVEVNNTFGERHCYLLNSRTLAWGQKTFASKCFHVSPFFENRGEYTFQFNHQGQHIVSTIELISPSGAKLKTSWTGHSEPATKRALHKAIALAPLMTLMVVVKIHWQALKLFAKRVPFFRQPKAPKDFISK